ncbi:hypothetical protein TrRE_jg3171 [Triparma retinervis]|uniref:AB hydrolase-1 domain-containing protein n=1 Tax=Triparma retinervis TaxID=2557542 RepID=A0A9W7AXY1_9STRA|nr:hypothetical protein TrRE_jg3171 [Triparma retinervis]
MADDFMRVGGVDEVHTLCFRGCSGSPNRTPGAYHLGFTDDLKHYLRLLSSSSPDSQVYLSGFSLGANVVLKALGELGGSAPSLNIAGAAVTCVPYDCEVCQPAVDGAGFNRQVYSRNFLKTLVKKTEEQFSSGLMDSVENFDMDKVTRCKTIGDFDNAVVAPIYGFTDKIDYYQRTSCLPFLKNIRVPFYVVNAMDDPFFDNSCYPSSTSINDLSGGDYMHVNYPDFGGHCGFMYHDDGKGGELRDDWMTNELARFVKAIDDHAVAAS